MISNMHGEKDSKFNFYFFLNFRVIGIGDKHCRETGQYV